MKGDPGRYECMCCSFVCELDNELKTHYELKHGSVTNPIKTRRDITRPRYDLIPKEWMDTLAAIMEEGLRYGERSWEGGDLVFARDCLNHAQDHLLRWHAGDTSEPQLGKVAWNALAAMTLYNKLKPKETTK